MRGISGAIVLLMAMAGCDFLSPAPPPPERAPVAPPAAVRTIEMILDGSGGPEYALWLTYARAEAGRARILFRDAAPDPDAPPARQAELIRAAVARGASGLLVIPRTTPEVISALEEARARGVAVVLLDPNDPAELAKLDKPFPTVVYEPFGPSADELVTAARREARKVGLADDGSAAIVKNLRTDRHTDDRIAALTAALESAGLERPKVISFEGSTPVSSAAVQTALRDDPRLTLVLAEEDDGFWGASQLFQPNRFVREFILAGYLVFQGRPSAGALGASAGVVDRNVDGLVHQAFDAALRLSEGQPVPARIVVPLSFFPGSPSLGPDAKARPVR